MATIVALLAAATVAAQTQAQMNADAAADWRRADAAMTATWRVTLAAMKRRDVRSHPRSELGYAGMLLQSQRAWITFRDRQCAIEGMEAYGGSSRAMIVSLCLAKLTKARTAQLKGLQWIR